MATVRYIVDDVDDAVTFYTQHLHFEIAMQPPTGFAMLARDDLRLLLNRPGAGGAGRPDNLGRLPEPGGWNRFQIVVTDLEAVLATLADAGVRIRTGLVEGGGGRQAVIEDPSGNAVELLEPPLH